MSDPAETRRVLVLDGDLAQSLACVRSLGRRGVRVTVGETRSPCLAGRSRHASESWVYPDPLLDPEAFNAAVLAWLAENACDMVLPMADNTLAPLAEVRDEVERHARLAVAPDEPLATMSDKARTFALAEEVGVPIPKGVTVTDAADLEAAAAALGWPVVVKPATSIQSAGGDVRAKLNVRYAFDAEELTRHAESALRYGPVVLQEYFRGTGVGVELLADHGEIVFAFQHRRLHEMPLTGGGSSYREAVAVDPMLLEDARQLVEASGWHGVAMVEMKVDEATGERRLMEVNGRFWGSLPLAVAAGADFPWMLLELETGGRRPAADATYRVGIRCRKLSHDVFWSTDVLRRADPSPLIEWPSRLSAVTTWFGVLHPKHRFDVQSLGDLAPGWADLKATLSDLVSRFAAGRRRAKHVRRMEALRGSEELAKRIAGARSLLFLCYGNINRSALAGCVLRERLGDDAGLEIVAAGFHPKAGRPADPTMVEVGRDRGVDLSASRSRVVDAEMLRAADLILAMDVSHLERLAALDASAAEKAVLLGCFLDEGPVEIADPYGRDVSDYIRCHDRIVAAVRSLAAAR